ncbi:MAG: recombination protein NinB [Pseudomonadota bacterium]|nr:recombination protein NinB [Pseudomonadota bacterium]
MLERMTLRLWSAQQGYQAITQAWHKAKALLMAGHRLIVEIRPETRSTAQNAKLHAMLGDIAKQVEWAGKKRDTNTWKRLMTAAWLRARGEQVEVLPAIDGHGVDIVFERTSRLSRAECGELMEFISAWGAEHGVEFREAMAWDVDPETGEILE